MRHLHNAGVLLKTRPKFGATRSGSGISTIGSDSVTALRDLDHGVDRTKAVTHLDMDSFNEIRRRCVTVPRMADDGLSRYVTTSLNGRPARPRARHRFRSAARRLLAAAHAASHIP